jgi:hypothetical protein
MGEQEPDWLEEAIRERRRALLAFPDPAACALCRRHIVPGAYRQPTTLYEPTGWSCEPCSRKDDQP